MSANLLFQIPQRYRFSSKSQQKTTVTIFAGRCFRYHKGTDFQANHNSFQCRHIASLVVLDTTKVQIFKQITTQVVRLITVLGCFRYHKGTDFQANHNRLQCLTVRFSVVLDTTKVQIFKQITTLSCLLSNSIKLFQIPQRYRFSSKSQPIAIRLHPISSCFRYHKGTDFQANHNIYGVYLYSCIVVLDTTKVQIFKQITTMVVYIALLVTLFQIPQRYRFSSKSQRLTPTLIHNVSCFRYHKGTDFQANHNVTIRNTCTIHVVLDTTKVQIFKQITTERASSSIRSPLFQIPQRYRFSSKSQHNVFRGLGYSRCFRYHKGTDFQANHNNMLVRASRFLLFQIPQRYRFSSKSQRSC